MGAYTPDHIVYAGISPCFSDGDPAEAVRSYEEKNGVPPKIVLARGIGAFALTSKPGGDPALALLFDAAKIARYAENFGGGRFMAPELVEFIRGWRSRATAARFPPEREPRPAVGKDGRYNRRSAGLRRGPGRRLLAANGATVVSPT